MMPRVDLAAGWVVIELLRDVEGDDEDRLSIWPGSSPAPRGRP
jgi:hypothetical protein